MYFYATSICLFIFTCTKLIHTYKVLFINVYFSWQVFVKIENGLHATKVVSIFDEKDIVESFSLLAQLSLD